MPLVRRVISAYGGVTARRVDAIEIPGAQGDILYFDGTLWVALPAGNAGQVLQTGGAGANPSWVNPAGATVTIVSTPYTTNLLERVILVDDDAAGGAVTVNLITAVGNDGLAYHIKKLGTSGNVIVDGSGAQTIDSETTQEITFQFNSMQVVSDGSNWHII